MIQLIKAARGNRTTSIAAYKKFIPRAKYKTTLETAHRLRKQTIIHINATEKGGGVAELLKSQIPLERSLGIDSRWLVIDAPESFFAVTKKIHNLLQGKEGTLTKKEYEEYVQTNKALGRSLKKILRRYRSGVVVIHDPQPMPLVEHIPPQFTCILRLHIDLSAPNAVTLNALKPCIEKYKMVIISNGDYCACLSWQGAPKVKVICPAIDPLTEKNRPMQAQTALRILGQLGIHETKPLVSQISRFDPWKDPMGVIEAYYIAKNEIPDLQLVLAGFFLAKDDPEAIKVFEKIEKYGKGDNDIHLFSDLKQLKDVSNEQFINALYTASTVVMQKSLREGFGLTVTEAMWKEKALVAGFTSGTAIQIRHNINGILVSSTKEAAAAVVRLLKDKKLREKIGKAARKSVAQRFLMPQFVLENMKLYISLTAKKKKKN